MLPFSYQVTRYLICVSVRVQCAVGLQDAYNSMYALTDELFGNLSNDERNTVADFWALERALQQFASRAMFGRL